MSYVQKVTWYASESDGGMKIWEGEKLPADLREKYPDAYSIVTIVNDELNPRVWDGKCVSGGEEIGDE